MADVNIVNSKLQTLTRLMNNIVVKQEKRALEFETDSIYLKYERYKFAIEELDVIDDYDGSWDLLSLIALFPGISPAILEKVANNEIPLERLVSEGILIQEDLEAALDNRRKWRIDNYIEENDYYRMLIGLPPLNEDPKNFVYVDGKPIHEITALEYYRLKRSGKLEVLIAEHPDKEYLQYIGKDISIFDAREAEQFQVLWVADTTESSIYREMFNRERRTYLVTYHNDHLTRTSDYNEAFELVQLKLRACIYYEIHMYSPTLDKSTFTKEESESLFKEFGLSFPKNMPDTYRDSISFVLSYMVMFKGTNYAVEFIADRVFSGLKLYKYFIRKRHKLGIKYPVDPETPPEEVYDVDFILRPYDATNILDSKDNTREEMVLTYDDVVQLDPRWRDTKELKRTIFSSDFSYLESKYISLDNMINLSEVSTGLSVISRMIVEHKDIFSSFSFVYNVTGIGHNFFNLWIYFLALYTTMVEHIRVKAPDTLNSINKVLGFKIPDNLQQVKIYWIWYFNMREDIRDYLRDFPNALQNDDDFLSLLVKVDKAIGIAKLLDIVTAKCRTFPEVQLVLDIYRLVRVVNTTPSAYGSIYPTKEGLAYSDYLETNDELLFLEYERASSAEDVNVLILEMDNMAQFLIQIINDHKTEMFPLNNIRNTINQLNMLIGGISKYLLYILKLFKAYSTDFINDSNILSMDDDFNYQLNIDQMFFKVDISMDQRWNMSQYDWVEAIYKDANPNNIFADTSTSSDGVYLITSVGDVKISD